MPKKKLITVQQMTQLNKDLQMKDCQAYISRKHGPTTAITEEVEHELAREWRARRCRYNAARKQKYAPLKMKSLDFKPK